MRDVLDRKWERADKLNEDPRFCWAGLVHWVQYGDDLHGADSGASCREDADRCGSCYCGKFRNDAKSQEEFRRWLARNRPRWPRCWWLSAVAAYRRVFGYEVPF